MDQLLEISDNHLSEEPILESLPVPKKRGRPKVVTQTEPEPLDLKALSVALARHLSSDKKQATSRRHAHWDGFF